MKSRGRIILLVGMHGFTLGCGDGDPTSTEAACPVGAPLEGDGRKLVALDVGFGEACAVADDGRVYCWGHLSARTPQPVAEAPSATAVAVGSPERCAIRPGGSVACWDDYEPVATVPGLCDATALTAELESRCAVVADDSVRCWGGLQEIIFGKRTSERAVAVPGVTGAVDVQAGPNGYTCALIADGSVTCWGGGPRLADRPSIMPEPVPEIAGAVALSGSPYSPEEMCAIVAGGVVTCWSHARAPAPVPSLENAVSVSQSSNHACAALTDGTVRCWGMNPIGQLGNGTLEDSEEPVTVEGLSNVVAVSVNGLDSLISTSCALLDDGTARCWGSNSGGMLGDGTYLDSSTPVVVAFP